MRKNGYFFVLLLCFTLGILLRLHAYLMNNSFFLDEILLSFNVIYKDYFQLLLPLNYDQAAPLFFLVLTKLVTNFFGNAEAVFRFIPFITGVFSLFAFYQLTKRILVKHWTRLLALLLFSINFQLLFYTQVFKPYSSDVLITILILLVGISLNINKISLKKAFLVGMLASVAISFSYPAIFSIIGVILVLTFSTKEYKKIFAIILPIIILLSIYFVLSLNSIKHSSLLNGYWANGYMIFNPNLYEGNFSFLFPFYKYPLIYLILTIAGLHLSYKSDRIKTIILASPILTTLIAAGLRLYPFERRLILFLLPIFLILITIPLDKIKLNKNLFNLSIITLSLIFFINYFIIYSTNIISQKVSYIRQDVKPLLKTLILEKKKEDILYIYYGANKTYLYYNLLFNLPKENLYIGSMPENENKQSNFIETDLNNLPKNKTIWFLFVKGNNLYDKDVKTYKYWIYNNGKIENDIILKSTRLIKVFL